MIVSSLFFFFFFFFAGKRYIEMFRRTSEAVFAQPDVPPLEQQIFTACMLTMQDLSEHHPDALRLLGWLAYLGTECVPASVFASSSLLGSRDAVFKASNVLREYALCQLPSEMGEFRVHALVQACVRRSDRGQVIKKNGRRIHLIIFTHAQKKPPKTIVAYKNTPPLCLVLTFLFLLFVSSFFLLLFCVVCFCLLRDREG
jgi:hypothetical protein